MPRAQTLQILYLIISQNYPLKPFLPKIYFSWGMFCSLRLQHHSHPITQVLHSHRLNQNIVCEFNWQHHSIYLRPDNNYTLLKLYLLIVFYLFQSFPTISKYKRVKIWKKNSWKILPENILLLIPSEYTIAYYLFG